MQVRDALAIEAGGILRIDNSRVAHYQLPPSLRFLSIAIAAIEDALRESGYHAMWQTNHGTPVDQIARNLRSYVPQ